MSFLTTNQKSITFCIQLFFASHCVEKAISILGICHAIRANPIFSLYKAEFVHNIANPYSQKTKSVGERGCAPEVI